MAAEKAAFDVSKFEQKRDEIFEMEKKAEWKVAKICQHSAAYRKSDNSSVFKFVRNMVGIPKDDCVKLVTDIPVRARYDTAVKDLKVIEDAGECQYVYLYAPFPFPCSDRDFVYCCKIFNDEATNTTMALYMHTVHPDAPEKPKVIRADTIFSGKIFRPDENDPNSSVYTEILLTDLKGWIPEFFINRMVGGTVDDARVKIDKFYKEVYVKEKESKQ